ncbi:hypothetical protein RND81_11G044000 [Saponaria officinalis]|uniref:Uncharacterized protein n=1 Tax=Saponaria officinalis TaxID=3572 RepID=A0AAW1HHX9_SAPOF
MDALSSVSPSMMLPLHRNRTISPLLHSPNHSFYLRSSNSRIFWKKKNVGEVRCRLRGESDGGEEREDDVEVEEALRLDGSIPGSCDEFVKQVSSRAYDIRRHLHQSLDSSSYDVLDANPWRDTSKPVYVLTQKENQLCTMKTRMNRSEVERELGMLFSKGRKRGSDFGSQPKQSRSGKKFQMVVEDVREGILVFEDQNDAARYCDLLQGGGQGCEGVAEIEAKYVFDLCRNSRALAVLFRRGRTPPQPDSLQLKLRSRKQSLED